MLLIGVNRSPYTRRVATLKAYGMPFEQRDLSGFGSRADVPRLHALCRRRLDEPPFRSTEP